MNFEEWYTIVIRACNSHDADIAYSSLRAWDKMITMAPASSREEMVKLKERLLFTAFPSLPLNQAVDIVEKQLLHLIGSDVDVDEIIKNRFLYLGYGNQEGDRKAFREAVLRNKQKLGEKTVAEWAQLFDASFPPEEREESAVAEFFTRVPGIVSMSRSEQNFLRKFLFVYNQWFASPVATIYDVAAVYKKINELEKAGVKSVNMKTFRTKYLMPLSGSEQNLSSRENSNSGSTSRRTVNIPLLQALSKYENLGNQLVTGERIKIKSQAEPVRPSLLYWIKYYRDELGIGQHNSVERGQFLFRSENGKKLSPEERERVNLILRSVEENFPLSIDTEREEILFPAFQGVLVPARNDSRSDSGRESHNELKAKPFMKASDAGAFQSNRPEFFNPEEKKIPYEKGGMRITPGLSFTPLKREDGSQQKESGAMSFSASHIFPAEKEVVERKPEVARSVPASIPAPVTRPQVEIPKSNPFSIHPVSRTEE